jgi:HemY protein
MAMIRLIASLIVIIAISWFAVWLAATPGLAVIEWHGYRLETSAAFFFLVFLFAATAVFTLFRSLIVIALFPRSLRSRRKLKAYETGLQTLTDAISAVAMQDVSRARRKLRLTQKYLPEQHPALLMVEAQLARLEKDDSALEKVWLQLSSNKNTRYYALGKMFESARASLDYPRALSLAEEAVRMVPGSEWALKGQIDLYGFLGRWQEALQAIKKAQKEKVLTQEGTDHLQAVIYYQQANRLIHSDETEPAIALLYESLKHDPAFLPAHLLLAQSYINQKAEAKAIKALGKAWDHAPHPQLAELFLQIHSTLSPKEKLKQVEKFAKRNANHRESYLLIAETAIHAGDLATAQTQLKQAMAQKTTPRVCRLMALLEEKQTNNAEAVNQWLERAIAAAPDPQWICQHCGHTQQGWTYHCAHCDQFNSLTWDDTRWQHLMPHSPSAPSTTEPMELLPGR